MKQETAERLLCAARATNIDCEIREKYSGRGMYGETTYAIVTGNALTFAKLAVLVGIYEPEFREFTNLAEEYADEIGKIRIDNMGTFYVYY